MTYLFLINLIIIICFLVFNTISAFFDCNDDDNPSIISKIILSIPYLIFVIIIGLILSFNIITSNDTKKIIKYVLYGFIISFILILDSFRKNIQCIGKKTIKKNGKNESIYLFYNNTIYNVIIFILLALNVMANPCLISDLFPDSSLISNIFQGNIINNINKYFNDDFIDYLNFENFNYLFVFIFLVTFIPNFIPNIQENFNNILYVIFILFYLIYTIYNTKLYKLFNFNLSGINGNQLLLSIIIIFIIGILFVKQTFDESAKFHNFIYFSIIIFCFFIIFLLKNRLFLNPFEKLGYLIGLNWHKLLFIFITIVILIFIYFMYNYYLKKYNITKCTKQNIKTYLANLAYNEYDNPDEQIKNKLCSYFNAKNKNELIDKIDKLNFDEDGCFNYKDLESILKIEYDNESKVFLVIKIIIVIVLFFSINIYVLIFSNIKLILKFIILILLIFVICFVLTFKLPTIYKSCDNNKIQCKDKFNRKDCSDNYYKMNFNTEINNYIIIGLILSIIIIFIMIYNNFLNSQLLFEKDKIFIIAFVIIIIICSFLLLQNNIIQN